MCKLILLFFILGIKTPDDRIVKKDLKEMIVDHFMTIKDGVETEVRRKIVVIKPENIKVRKTRLINLVLQATVVIQHLLHLHLKVKSCRWTTLLTLQEDT